MVKIRDYHCIKFDRLKWNCRYIYIYIWISLRTAHICAYFSRIRQLFSSLSFSFSFYIYFFFPPFIAVGIYSLWCFLLYSNLYSLFRAWKEIERERERAIEWEIEAKTKEYTYKSWKTVAHSMWIDFWCILYCIVYSHLITFFLLSWA